ncbi:MAG TPA: prepilin-type N-terminal cleavage/methylation domain-containing protein [Gammaproteobacteria bacterium]|nr:prepilin-type N-terminal cleavage/methylation domain-containing protein [Gammaproteobacteria bacterium]
MNNKTLNKSAFRTRQQGFSLVEILVAITIGLVMMAGILQVSQANKESNRLQRNLGFVQENTRTAMDLLARDIHAAGYYENDDPANPITDPIPRFITATTLDDSNAANTTGSDMITVNYESDRDCLGQLTYDDTDPTAVASNHFAINRWFIQNQRLMCQGTRGNAMPLVEGVESLQILYGENTDGDPRSANRYVRAEQVANMNNVVSVRIALRLISREAVRPSTDTHQYVLLDEAPFTPATNDRLLRREIATTLALRNMQ